MLTVGTHSDTELTLFVAVGSPNPQIRIAVHTTPISRFMNGPPSIMIMRLYTGSL